MLWIVGKVFKEFRQYLDEHAISYGVFWDQQLLMPAAYTMPVVALDFSNPENLAIQLRNHPDLEVSAITVSGYENYVLAAAYIAQFFNVPGMSVEAATAATDKVVMRQAFTANAPHLTPDFCEVSEWQDVTAFMANHQFPVMLKPANLMKSLLITKNTSLEELQHNYQQLQAEITKLYERYSIGQPPKVILEEFLRGSMHTVAGFVDNTGKTNLVPVIADCVTAPEIGIDDSFLFSRELPSKLSPGDQSQVLDAAAQGVAALKLTSTAVHVELMLTDAGPKIIEIGARIGGYRARMYDYACGIDLYAGVIRTALNQPIELQAARSEGCSVIELFPTSEGLFDSFPAFAAIQALASAKHSGLKAKPGDMVGRASQGYKATALVILVNADATQLQRDYQFVLASAQDVRLRT